MNLLATERIKLLSTSAPWLCAVLTVALTTGLAGMIALESSGEHPISTGATQTGYQFGVAVVMVMAALAVTTEYRTGTIRTTFQAIPNRVAALTAKAGVVALLAGVVGELAAFAAWGAGTLLANAGTPTLAAAADWRAVAGVGLVYALAAVLALGVGLVVRHSAGAVVVVLLYPLVIENLVTLVPRVGVDVHAWLPFTVVQRFLGQSEGATTALGPWGALAYFAGFAVVIFTGAVLLARRRDA